MYYNTLVKVVSMDVETIAVIKKNSKNNNTKGCVKVMEELWMECIILSIMEETWFPRMCQQKIFEWKEYVKGKYYGIFSNLS